MNTRKNILRAVILSSLGVTAALAIVVGCGGDTTKPSTSSTTTAQDAGVVATTQNVPATCSGTVCGGLCVDTKKDVTNCGACGTACAADQVCSNGACASSCNGGTTQCGSTCEDLQNDPANCGACGKACAQGEVCGNGTCGLTCTASYSLCTNGPVLPDGGAIPSGSSDAGADGGDGGASDAGATDAGAPAPRCANLQTSTNDCGLCGVHCGAGELCSNGTCCSAGTVACNGTCTDTRFDEANCGACGTTCSGNTPVCSAGQCIAIPTSCAAIKTAQPTATDGVYTIDPDGAGSVAAVDVYCDMTNDGGGWTLIESTANGLGPSGLAKQAPVLPGTARYLDGTVVQALANISHQVHVRTPGAIATKSITSVADTAPITNLRNLVVTNSGIAGAAQVSDWTGPMATSYTLSFSCTANAAWPSVYHACGNSNGFHLVTVNSRWDWDNGRTTENGPLETYVK